MDFDKGALVEYYDSVRYHGSITALRFQKCICYYLKSTGNNVCYQTFVTFYNSKHESVTCWSHQGYISPPNKNFILIRHNRINHFAWIKHGVHSKQPTKVLNISVMGDVKYLPVNDKTLSPSIDNVTNIETKKDVQTLPVSWDPADRNINPPPTIHSFEHKQSLSCRRFVKNKKIIHQ